MVWLAVAAAAAAVVVLFAAADAEPSNDTDFATVAALPKENRNTENLSIKVKQNEVGTLTLNGKKYFKEHRLKLKYPFIMVTLALQYKSKFDRK